MKITIKDIFVLFILASVTHISYSQSWNLTGNSGTNSTTNFIGTSDNTNLKIRTNNSIRMNITSSGKVAIGNFYPVFKLDVKGGSINTDSVYRIGGKTILSIKGGQNIFVGAYCGGANTTGTTNTGIGTAALYTNTEGASNTAAGSDALFSNTNGSWNTASGTSALFTNTTGSFNIAIGSNTLYHNTEGNENTGNGYAALHDNNIGYENTAIGSFALNNNTEGYFNTALGTNSLTINLTGNNNTALGHSANASVGGLIYATAIGSAAVVNSNDKVRVGDAGISVVEGQVVYSWPSDERFKENIKEDVMGLDFILKLQPVSYNFNRLKFAQHTRQQVTPGREKTLIEKSQIRTVGFIAQDVEKIIEQTGFNAFDAVHAPTGPTDNYSMGYAEFVVPIVKSIQELNRKNDSLRDANVQLIKRIELLEQINTISDRNQNEAVNDKMIFLEQNNPNPFREKTTIGFYIPFASEKASLKIFSMTGEELQSYAIPTKGRGEIEIAGNTFTQGIYTYVLIVDGKSIDTKQMVLTK